MKKHSGIRISENMSDAQKKSASILANYHELVALTWSPSMAFERLRLLGLILDGINTSAELTNTVGLTRSAVSRGSKQLEEFGAITIVPNTKNGRGTTTFEPTQKALAFLDNAMAIFDDSMHLPKHYKPADSWVR
ncbi:hypothetical protein EGM51_00035 [Verrucomicrobia bacterium S94]|nr:hypothetical protein EGM51_00035 [Verrucomicrobia bacterium S94]